MSFESCFGGFAGSKSAPAAMGGQPTFTATLWNDGVAPKAPIGVRAQSRGKQVTGRSRDGA